MRLFLAAAFGFLPHAGLAFELGSLGDAYRDTGYVQGCTDTGELPGCTIIAGGSQFVLMADGPTPPAVMATLRGLPQLARVDFSGDIINVYDSFAEMAVAFVAVSETPDPDRDTLLALQGAWQSSRDPLVRAQVDGLIWTDIHDGAEVMRSIMALGTGCSDGTQVAGRTLEMFVLESYEPTAFCYGLTGATPDTLSLTYLPRGNPLVFVRP